MKSRPKLIITLSSLLIVSTFCFGVFANTLASLQTNGGNMIYIKPAVTDKPTIDVIPDNNGSLIKPGNSIDSSITYPDGETKENITIETTGSSENKLTSVDPIEGIDNPSIVIPDYIEDESGNKSYITSVGEGALSNISSKETLIIPSKVNYIDYLNYNYAGDPSKVRRIVLQCETIPELRKSLWGVGIIGVKTALPNPDEYVNYSLYVRKSLYNDYITSIKSNNSSTNWHMYKSLNGNPIRIFSIEDYINKEYNINDKFKYGLKDLYDSNFISYLKGNN